jgi:hypothetical protein
MAIKKGRLTGALMGLFFLVPKLFGFVGDIGTLVKLEALQAKRTMTIIIFLTLICAMLFASTWLILFAMLYVYLVTKLSAIASLAIILVLNIFFMIIIGLLILNRKRNIFFPATLSHLSKVKSKF